MKTPLTLTPSANQQPSSETLKLCEQALQALFDRKKIGFTQLPARKELWEKSQVAGDAFRKKFKRMVLIGIGGSSLGPQTLEDIFGEGNFHVLDNPDPMLLAKTEKKIDATPDGWATTGFVIISKSGGTLETAALASHIAEKLRSKNLSLKEHIVAITEPNMNPLRRWADANGCLALDVPLDVGGRFSVLSPVGMMPAAFLGLSTEEFRKGAETAVNDRANVVKMMAMAKDSFDRGEWVTMCFFYSSFMRSFGGWWQQLWAESLAKKTDTQGKPAPRASTPIGATGACDQHSLLQQMMEGYQDKWIIFARVRELSNQGPVITKPLFEEVGYTQGHRLGHILNVEARATQEGLRQAGVSVAEMELDALTPFTVGYLFMFWQLVVGGLGDVLGIDAFNQPGVELAKRLARENLVRP